MLSNLSSADAAGSSERLEQFPLLRRDLARFGIEDTQGAERKTVGGAEPAKSAVDDA